MWVPVVEDVLISMKSEGRDGDGRGSLRSAERTPGTGVRSHPVASSGERERQKNTTEGWSNKLEAGTKE